METAWTTKCGMGSKTTAKVGVVCVMTALAMHHHSIIEDAVLLTSCRSIEESVGPCEGTLTDACPMLQ